MTYRRGTLLFLLLLLTLSSMSVATETTKQDVGVFVAIRRECRDNANRIQQIVNADPPNDTTNVTVLREELNLWQQIELTVAQRETVAEAMQMAGTGASSTDFKKTEITSFMELEETRETLALTSHNLAALESELVAEHTLALETRELLERAEQDHRRTTENLLTAAIESRPALQQQQRLDSLRIRLHRQQHDLHHDTIAEMEQRERRIRSILKDLYAQVEIARPRVRLAKSEVNDELKRFGEIEDRVRSQLSMLDQRMRMHLSETNIQRSDDKSNQLEVIREESQLLRQLLTEIVAIRECWNRRYEFSNQKTSNKQLRSWREDALQAELRLERIRERLANRSSQRRQQMIAIQRRLSSEPATDTDRTDELAQLEAIVISYGTLQEMAARGQRIYKRFAEDLELRQSRFSLRASVAWCASRIGELWHFELTAVDDRSVTVGKLATALILLIVGMLISARVASTIAFRILPRFGFSHAAATTIRQVMIYGLFAATTMLSLHMVNVPLTVFAFLGGAVAIGVGFGSQNTIANFISGLILLIQRPIRIGDLVNVDGIDANVEQIGARATRVRTSENLEILIPNHNILNNNVTNWTLSDTRIRTSVSVGVAYGTPVRPVQKVLKRVVVEHPKVIRESEPIVIFEDFGDSSLVFDVHFWIHMRTIMDRSIVRSDIRVAIDDAFRREGIVIAFPQRDVHLDLEGPLEIALTDARSAPQQQRGRAA